MPCQLLCIDSKASAHGQQNCSKSPEQSSEYRYIGTKKSINNRQSTTKQRVSAPMQSARDPLLQSKPSETAYRLRSPHAPFFRGGIVGGSAKNFPLHPLPCLASEDASIDSNDPSRPLCPRLSCLVLQHVPLCIQRLLLALFDVLQSALCKLCVGGHNQTAHHNVTSALALYSHILKGTRKRNGTGGSAASKDANTRENRRMHGEGKNNVAHDAMLQTLCVAYETHIAYRYPRALRTHTH